MKGGVLKWKPFWLIDLLEEAIWFGTDTPVFLFHLESEIKKEKMLFIISICGSALSAILFSAWCLVFNPTNTMIHP